MAKSKQRKQNHRSKRHEKSSVTSKNASSSTSESTNYVFGAAIVGILAVSAVFLPRSFSTLSSLYSTTADTSTTTGSSTTKNGSYFSNDDETESPTTCRFVMATSTIPNAGFGVFSTVPIDAYEPLLPGEPVIQVPDMLQHDGFAFLLNRYAWAAEFTGGQDESPRAGGVLSIIPGISMLANSHATRRNAVSDHPQIHHNGLQRGESPSAGANTHYHGLTHYANAKIAAGQEILVDYGRGWDHKIAAEDESLPESKRSVEWLQQNGMCLDHLKPGPSSGRGQGAFAQRAFGQGQVVAPLPVVALDRASLKMMPPRQEQLLINYCYGHANSSVVLFPYAPTVNLLNHDATNYNAVVQWSSRMVSKDEWFNLTASQVLAKHESGLLLELVAKRAITKGEEILIDYGVDYQAAWDTHVASFTPTVDNDYVYSFEANREWNTIKTAQEQESDPYPANLQMSCLHQYDPAHIDSCTKDEKSQVTTCRAHFVMDRMLFQPHNLKPCRILERRLLDDGRHHVYTVEIVARDAVQHIVAGLPREALFLTNVPGTTDQHLPEAFRHAIGFSDFPLQWMDLVDK